MKIVETLKMISTESVLLKILSHCVIHKTSEKTINKFVFIIRKTT